MRRVLMWMFLMLVFGAGTSAVTAVSYAGPGGRARAPSPPGADSTSRLPALRVGIAVRGRGASAAMVKVPGCLIQPAEDTQEGLPIPSKITFAVAILCPAHGSARVAIASIVNARGHRVSGHAACARAKGLTCLAKGTYTPKLHGYTRVLGVHGHAVLVTTIKHAIWVPVPNSRTLKHCAGFGTPVLTCNWTDDFVTPDHRCDLTPVNESVAASNHPDERYPGVAPFVDGLGHQSRLLWGRTKFVGPTNGVFWDGFGYRHIAAKHGWGPADEAATRAAILRRPVRTIPSRKRTRRIYEGSRYTQNQAACRRVVAIDYPKQHGQSGNIVTSYGAVVGEPKSTPFSQG